MGSVLFNANAKDAARREQLYAGELFVLTDYLRGVDLSRVPEEIVARYEAQAREVGSLV